ncbi:MAG: arginase family protein [Planctomycetes bacterium]|nr:arginase family protein [Planctomycetota bacterium]
MTNSQTVALVGVPMDLGGGRRGVDMGPSAVRIAGIEEGVRGLGNDFVDCGNVPVPEPASRTPVDPKARFLPEIARACGELREARRGHPREGWFPMVVGGDHSIAVSTVAALSATTEEKRSA